MVFLVYCAETASSNIATAFGEMLHLHEGDDFHGMKHFEDGDTHMIEVSGNLFEADLLDGMVKDDIIFLSRHSSNKGIPAFTVHPEGNWSDEALLGGRPKELSVACPLRMVGLLCSINKLNNTSLQVTYEATHHGPFLNCPSLFVELGGDRDTVANRSYAELLAKSIEKSLYDRAEYGKVVVGIGGVHYPEKFTRCTLEGKYAFAHIMPKHHAHRVDMLKKAFERSDAEPELAVLEWKGIKAADRETILRELNTLGVDYAKV